MLSTQSKWKYLHTRSIISWEHPFPCWPIQLATPAIMVAPAAPTVPAPTVVAPAILPVPRQVVTHDHFTFYHHLSLPIVAEILS